MPDSVYLLIVIPVCIAAVYWAFRLARWEEWDDYRRLERRAHLNLMRQGGEWEL